MSKRSDIGFELYTNLGVERSYGRVAEIMGLKEGTVRNWASKENWQERLNAEIAKKNIELKAKKEELEVLGFDVAIAALQKIKAQIETGGLSKELGQIYEIFLTSPFKVIEEARGVESQSADATPVNVAGTNITLSFDMNGGPDHDD